MQPWQTAHSVSWEVCFRTNLATPKIQTFEEKEDYLVRQNSQSLYRHGLYMNTCKQLSFINYHTQTWRKLTRKAKNAGIYAVLRILSSFPIRYYII